VTIYIDVCFIYESLQNKIMLKDINIKIRYTYI